MGGSFEDDGEVAKGKEDEPERGRNCEGENGRKTVAVAIAVAVKIVDSRGWKTSNYSYGC